MGTLKDAYFGVTIYYVSILRLKQMNNKVTKV